MIWIITKRRILKEIHKKRWYGGISGAVLTQTDFERYNNGVPSNNLETSFFNDLSKTIINKRVPDHLLKILGLIIPYYKDYIKKFIPRIKHKFNILKEENYLKEENGYFILTGKGEDLISLFYYFRLILNHPLVIEIVKVIKWIIIGLITWILTKAGIIIGS